MKQNRDCKIVQDLLPNYIEDLTDEVTNEYIEEHISKCSDCAQILKDMNSEIDIEQINQEQEIKYLKKLKRKWIQSIPVIAIILIIIATSVVAYINYKSQIKVNNYTFLRAQYTMQDNNGIDGNIYGTLVAVINEKGICKSVRMVQEGYEKEKLEEEYEMINRPNKIYTNIKLENNKLYYNINLWNGYTKEEFKEHLKESYNVKSIEEI